MEGCEVSEDFTFTSLFPGRLTFEAGLALQDDLASKRHAGEIDDTLIFLEHEPVYTIGRTRDRSSLREGIELPAPLVEINRGGQATYHGPGQLTGYLILDLHRYGSDLHTFLRTIEQSLIDFLLAEGVAAAGRSEGQTGVWVEDRKIASIGVGVRRWISMHGFAINVAEDLSGFDAIVPCGIQGVEMTSIARETAREWTIETAAKAIEPHLLLNLRRLGGETD